MIIVNLPTLRDTYFFMGKSLKLQYNLIEEKPKFLFEFFYSSGVFDSTHPVYHILEKLIQVDKENEKRCQAESTFDWDLFLVNLLIKLTLFLFVSSFLFIVFHFIILLKKLLHLILVSQQVQLFFNYSTILFLLYSISTLSNHYSLFINKMVHNNHLIT